MGKLSEKYPEIINIWDTKKNIEIGLNFYDVAITSSKAWFYCSKCDDSYLASISNKVKGSKCSYCTGRLVNFRNSLYNNNPKISSEWHPTRNGELSPKDVTLGSSKVVWWLGNCGHEWKSPISRRNVSNCPYCSNQKVLKGFNDIFTTDPELALEFDICKNTISPYEISSGSYVWWKCKEGHGWKERPVTRKKIKSKCPYCNGKRVLLGYNDCATTNSKLAKLLLNKEDANNYMQSSKHKVDWKCECGTIIRNRAFNHICRYGLSCPTCSDNLSMGEKLMFLLLKKNKN